MMPLPRSIMLSLCVLTLAACAGDAADDESQVQDAADTEQAEMAAPEASPLAQWVGTWEAVAVMESGDTVPYTLTATEDREGWRITLPGRDPMPLRILTAEADSIVTEMGPYQSLLRDGVEVTVRQVARIQDGRITGTMEAEYAGGEGASVVGGEVEGSRVN